MLVAKTAVANVAGSRQQSAGVKVAARDAGPTRRSLLLGTLAGGLLLGVPAQRAVATDFKEALARKEARKARLKEAAGQIKSSGKDQQVFKKSSYSLPEEAHTPNIHTRQNEGARTQDNV